MFHRSDLSRDQYMLTGPFRRKGYDWWWHSFTGRSESTGEEKSFFIEYYACNPALAQAVPVLGQHPYNQNLRRRPSYFMVKAGCWGTDACQLHRFYPWSEVMIRRTVPFVIDTGSCHASETDLRGAIHVTLAEAAAHPEYMCDAGSMEWELTVEKQISFNVGYGAGRFFRKIKAFEMYWHAEGMKSRYSGTVTFNGERYIVEPETSFGYADKNWGRGFTSPWVWLSSNSLRSNITGKTLDNSVFDIGGGCPKIWFLPLRRKLLGAFWYEGAEYEYNFSKFRTRPKTSFSSEETGDAVLWHVRQENRRSVMVTEVRCPKSEMLLINYEAPDGTKKHNRLWNGGTGIGNIRLYRKKGGELELIDDIAADHIGCEYGEYDG